MTLQPSLSDKFTFGLWTVGNRGRDPFGEFVRPALDPCDAVTRLSELGAYGVNFHDNDLVPIDASPADRDRIVREFRRALDSTGMKVPMATTNLFTDPVFKDGAFTSHDPQVRAYAVQKTMKAMDLGVELGAHTYVFWGGREGAEVDAGKDPIEAIKRFRSAIDFLCEYARDQKYNLRFALEAKPNEPRGDIYFPTTAAYLGFIPTLAHPEMVGVNPEVAHEQMAGLNFYHAVAQALEAGKLFHIDLNDQKPGRFDQDLRFGSESIKPLFFLVKLLEESGYDGPRHFDAHAYRTEDADGVWDFAGGCMRTYLILKEKARQFCADKEIQALLAEIRGDGGPAEAGPHNDRRVRLQADHEHGAYSRETAQQLKNRTFDRQALAARPLPYEKLDQLVVDLLLGVRVKLYLGLDSSTQSLTAIVIEVDGTDARVVFDASLSFDEAFPQYGTDHGVLPRMQPDEAFSSPIMWAEALETILERVAASGLEVSRIAAISGSAQQHGSVYLNADAPRMLSRLDPAQPLASQVAPILARRVSPIWLDSSTSAECAEITDAVGGPGLLAQHTGSRAFERFTGPQIRKFAAVDPDGYAATARVHLVSSYLASLLVGGHAPIDPGDASGANLMDLADKQWWTAAVSATAPGLADKLPTIAPSWSVAGTLSPYWQTRLRLPPARVIAWSGDNPCSLIGVGLVREGRVAISLGTSDTIFGLMKEPRVDPSGTGHVFAAPTGDYMGLTCFSNGSLARERVQDVYGFTWTDFSRALDVTPAGNQGRVLIPWFEPEITPAVADPRVHRYRLSADDAAANVRAVVEAQQMAMAMHSTWMSVTIDTIHATGGAAANTQILQVMADVFSAEVYRSTVSNSAALGAALRAWHGDTVAEGTPLPWETITAIAQPNTASLIAPDPRRHAVYRELLPVYEACEAHALGRGPDPTPALERFAHSRA